MEELSYPSEDMMEEVVEGAEDVNVEDDHSRDTNVPPSHQSDYHDQMPETLDRVQEIVNLLQQFYDSCMETQTHILSLVMEISNRLGDSVDEVKKGEKRLGEASYGVEANQEKNVGDQEKDDCPSGFERLQQKSLGNLIATTSPTVDCQRKAMIH
ncbi:hypothetical protein ACET3Z_018000 [Daucus carota]